MKTHKTKVFVYLFIFNLIALTSSCGKYGKLEVNNTAKNQEETKEKTKLQEYEKTKKQNYIDYYDSDFVF